MNWIIQTKPPAPGMTGAHCWQHHISVKAVSVLQNPGYTQSGTSDTATKQGQRFPADVRKGGGGGRHPDPFLVGCEIHGFLTYPSIWFMPMSKKYHKSFRVRYHKTRTHTVEKAWRCVQIQRYSQKTYWISGTCHLMQQPELRCFLSSS